MSDIGSKPLPRRALECGDRVRPRGVLETHEGYDEGRIISFCFNGARVLWERANEVYTEDLAELERIESVSHG